MRRESYVVAVLLAVALVPTAAHAQTALLRERPTPTEARDAARQVYGYVAEAFDGRLILASCRPAGDFSRACYGRIYGPSPMRLRILVTGDTKNLTVRARFSRRSTATGAAG